MNWSGVPWYGQVVILIVAAILFVFLFREVILPLLSKVT
jgi:hypothetical protein